MRHTAIRTTPAGITAVSMNYVEIRRLRARTSIRHVGMLHVLRDELGLPPESPLIVHVESPDPEPAMRVNS